MTRAQAPSFQPAEAGGAKTKARIGVSPEKATNTSRGGHCFPPVVQWTELPSRKGPVAGSNPARGTFYFS